MQLLLQRQFERELSTSSFKGYFGVGGIWYDPNLKEHLYAVFGVKYFEGSHRASDCLGLLEECLSKYALQHSFIHIAVADGAGNVQNVCFEGGNPNARKMFPMRYCVCHMIQTAIL